MNSISLLQVKNFIIRVILPSKNKSKMLYGYVNHTHTQCIWNVYTSLGSMHFLHVGLALACTNRSHPCTGCHSHFTVNITNSYLHSIWYGLKEVDQLLGTVVAEGHLMPEMLEVGFMESYQMDLMTLLGSQDLHTLLSELLHSLSRDRWGSHGSSSGLCTCWLQICKK